MKMHEPQAHTLNGSYPWYHQAISAQQKRQASKVPDALQDRGSQQGREPFHHFLFAALLRKVKPADELVELLPRP